MAEAEWLTGADPGPMLALVPAGASERKLRLYLVAGCRSVWERFRDERCRRAIEAGERYADGRLGAPALDEALTAARKAFDEVRRPARKAARRGRRIAPMAVAAAVCARLPAWPSASPELVLPALSTSVSDLGGGDVSGLAALLRDIFGNRFRPVAFAPEWRTDTAVAIARGMYDARDFGAMPILADALQDAGCDSAEVLNHCRGPGPHVRGCWAVDLVLGKE